MKCDRVGFGVEMWWYRSFNEAAAVEACSFSFTVAVGDLMTEKKSLLHLLCTNVSTCVAIALRLALGDSETWETQMLVLNIKHNLTITPIGHSTGADSVQ